MIAQWARSVLIGVVRLGGGGMRCISYASDLQRALEIPPVLWGPSHDIDRLFYLRP